MKSKNWREVAEIVGIVSIVVGLVLVAWEVRQANNIAKTQMVMDLAAEANEFNSATFENTEVAELVAAIYDPNHSEYTDAQEAMMSAVAWHFANLFWSAQRAYDNGLLGDDDILMYQSSLAWHIENMPSMRPWYRDPGIRSSTIRRPGFEICLCFNHWSNLHVDLRLLAAISRQTTSRSWHDCWVDSLDVSQEVTDRYW
jgi:hypothetical protein